MYTPMNTVAAAYRVVVLFEFITSVNESNISIGEYHYDVLTDGQYIALVRVEDRETVAEYQLVNGSWVEVIEPGMVARQAIEVLNDINAKYSEWELNHVYHGALVEDYEDMDQLLSLPLHSVEVDDIPFQALCPKRARCGVDSSLLTEQALWQFCLYYMFTISLGSYAISNNGKKGLVVEISGGKAKLLLSDNTKLHYSLSSLRPMGPVAKLVEYNYAQYLVTPKDTIVSVCTGRIMKWNDSHKERSAILSLAHSI